jgi:hypothetical protein
MSKRGTEFIDQWVKANLHTRAPEAGGPAEWAEQCTYAAFEAGIPKEELEEDFGDMKKYMEMAITDEAAMRAEAGGTGGALIPGKH